MNAEIDGLYAAYLTGRSGQTFAMLLFGEQRVSGADAGGVMYDGKYIKTEDNGYHVTMDVKAPPHSALIQGAVTGVNGEQDHLNFSLPNDFSSRDFVRIETLHGPVNAKLVKVRDI
jgi:hypothetical protein